MSAATKKTVGEFVRKLDLERREIFETLRDLINKAAPDAEELIAWSIPWWKQNGWLCSIYTAGDHINFGFSRGAELDDPDGLLEGTGKGMRHVKLSSVKDIRKKQFTAWVKQAVKLNMEDA